MTHFYGRAIILLLAGLLSLSECFALSGIYVGGHIRRERPGTITKLKESGFNYVILFNVNVEADGTLTTDGETICQNGTYVFGNTQPNYIADVKALKAAPTSIKRIEICIGGWGNTSYDNIKSLIASSGTGSNSMLYKNFQALKNAIPEIDAVNNDDEHCYDLNSGAAFHIMMSDLGYKSTLAPYMNKSYWVNLTTSINYSRAGAVDRILIQCYDGGAGNNPSDWHINGITLHAGRLNYQDFTETKTVMQDWKNNKAVTGGFYWVYNDETWDLNTYATATNRIFGAKTTNAPIATFYSDINYGGYAIQLPLGSFTTADMAVYGLTNNDLTSLKVNAGYQVTIYVDNNFGGNATTYTSDQTWVGDFNDKISSIKIEKVCKKSDAAVATFYADIDYAGNEASLPEGTFNLANLSDYCIADNSITSIKVKPGYKVTIYVDDNFTGTTTSYTSNQNWIGTYNDKISSIKIEASGVVGKSGKYKIKGRNSGLFMDVKGNKVDNGTKIIQYNSTISTNQHFELIEINNGVYKIKGLQSGKYLDISAGSTANWADLQIWDNADVNNQQFILVDAGDGFYQLVARHCGKVLEIPNNSLAAGDYVKQYDNNLQTCSHWLLDDLIKIPSNVNVTPTTKNLTIGDTLSLTVVATGLELLYQWKKDGADIANATSNSYTINTVGIANSGVYTCEVSNSKGKTLSNNASITVNHFSFTTDITDNAGELTASHIGFNANETIDKIIDNVATTKYCATVAAGASVWLQYQSSKLGIVESYSITSANDAPERDPKAWVLQASNNGIDWIDIDTQSNQTFKARYFKKTYTVNSTEKYMFFRLYVTEKNSSSATVFQIAEWQLFGEEFDITTDIVNDNELNAIQIFPNPASTTLYIQSDEAIIQIIICNLQGKELNKTTECNVDLESLTSGCYMVKIKQDNQVIYKKFIKQ